MNHKQNNDHILYLCSSLCDYSTVGFSQLQARQVLSELLSTKQRPITRELLEIRVGNDSVDDNRLPTLPAPDNEVRYIKRFNCECTRLSIDEQRQLYLVRPNQDKSVNPKAIEMLSDSKTSWRKKLIARFVHKRQRSWRKNEMDKTEMAMYLLEPLIESARRYLAEHLQHEAVMFGRQTESFRQESESEDVTVAVPEQQLRASVMIRAPRFTSNQDKSSQSRQDSGIDLAVGPIDVSSGGYSNKKWTKLEEWVGFHSSEQVQSMLRHSMSFFAKLISECPLLSSLSKNLPTIGIDQHSEQDGQARAMSLHEFKLAACVECQRLRASIRFEWLANCLLLAFGSDMTIEKLGRPNFLNLDKLPKLASNGNVPEEEQDMKRYNILSYLMGQLLRQHFLEPSLNLFCAQFNVHHMAQAGADIDPMLVVQIELQEVGEKVGHSRADSQLRSALEFIVDEIGSVCANVPRLESQLDCTRQQDFRVVKKDERDHISVLQQGDDLLEQTKRRVRQFNLDLGGLRSRPNQQDDCEWLHKYYRLAIRLINLLRTDSQNDEHSGEHLLGRILAEIGEANEYPTQIGQNEGTFLRQLRVSSRQISTIDLLKSKLIREAPRYVRLSLAKLDCEPLRIALLGCLERERNLLVRLNLDAILKLIERLRLQFDEIELGCDLETSIEDYLSDKWQAKHSQQPNKSEQILLAGEDENLDFVDLDDGPDLDIESGEFVESQNTNQRENEIRAERATSRAEEQVSEEEQFVDAIHTGTNRSGMQTTSETEQFLSTMQANTNVAGQTILSSGFADRRVAPLIECQLLVKKYQFVDRLLLEDLDQLVLELAEAFEGLVFLSECAHGDQLEQAHCDLVAELSLRAQSFAGEMLTGAIKRLDLARKRLLRLNQLRQRVLNQVFVEFHLLMVAISRRKLVHQLDGQEENVPAELVGGSNVDCIRLLDGFQESSELATKLEQRCFYLSKQNVLLEKELSLLTEAKIISASCQQKSETILDPQVMQQNFEDRRDIIALWSPHVSLLASFWRLVEEFETNLVKWLNSDTKRLEFRSIEGDFLDCVRRGDEIRARYNLLAREPHSERRPIERTLEENFKELEFKFRHFQERRLPPFKFLTNRHLTKNHWSKLSKLLGVDVTASNRHTYITLAQFLEIHIDAHIDELENLDKQATMEHELGMFLMAEADRLKGSDAHHKQVRSLDVSAFLDNWSEQDLELAASRFIECKFEQLSSSHLGQSDCLDSRLLARHLVAKHSAVMRYLRLVCHLNLDFCCTTKGRLQIGPSEDNRVILCSHRALKSPNSLRASFFVEFIRLFAHRWLESQQELLAKQLELQAGIAIVEEHLAEIRSLIGSVNDLESNDLRVVNEENNQLLVRIERETLRLELEREILATREVLAIDRQREALVKRDHCIRQITERAIPALRAATKALSCLDGRALRALRNLRPNPPEPVRHVIEAICLLKSCVGAGSQPLIAERRFDAVRGVIISDYWPPACRLLNGQHSTKFIADLKRVSEKMIPAEVMRLIRRRYLSSARFKLNLIANISRECALLAKWLIAVDVFDRVINVVRPDYRQYTEAEGRLADLLAEVTSQRRLMESTEVELRQLEDLFRTKLGHKTTLSDLLEECKSRMRTVDSSRSELLSKRETYMKNLERLSRKRKNLAACCILDAAELIYVNPARSANLEAGERLFALLQRPAGINQRMDRTKTAAAAATTTTTTTTID